MLLVFHGQINYLCTFYTESVGVNFNFNGMYILMNSIHFQILLNVFPHFFSEERVSPRIVVSSRPNSPTSHGADLLSASSSSSSSVFGLSQWQCQHCNIIFPDQTLYFLHRGFHSNSSDPWKCNGCARRCADMYDFNTHLMSEAHH